MDEDAFRLQSDKVTRTTSVTTPAGNLVFEDDFDGTSLDNFNIVGTANWKLGGGMVEATSGPGFLVTKENYAGADLIERVWIVNNTIVGGQYGITGGDNMVLLNNVITGVARTALKRVHGDSAAGKNLLWRNGMDVDECDL